MTVNYYQKVITNCIIRDREDAENIANQEEIAKYEEMRDMNEEILRVLDMAKEDMRKMTKREKMEAKRAGKKAKAEEVNF